MFKNALNYLYTFIFATIIVILVALFNKTKRLEIQLLKTRELGNIVNNTDIKVDGLMKQVGELNKQVSEQEKKQQEQQVPEPVQEQYEEPDLEMGELLGALQQSIFGAGIPMPQPEFPYAPVPTNEENIEVIEEDEEELIKEVPQLEREDTIVEEVEPVIDLTEVNE